MNQLTSENRSMMHWQKFGELEGQALDRDKLDLTNKEIELIFNDFELIMKHTRKW